MYNMKFAVQAVILNSVGEVLLVSRKDNHEDFGLPGGKVDPGDSKNNHLSSLENAIVREVKEETGINIDTVNMIQVFSSHRDGYMGYTYLINNWEGEFDYDEPHVVKWGPFLEAMEGSFGEWNEMVCNSLISMGIKFKINGNKFV